MFPTWSVGLIAHVFLAGHRCLFHPLLQINNVRAELAIVVQPHTVYGIQCSSTENS